jgi:hypothetical protein
MRKEMALVDWLIGGVVALIVVFSCWKIISSV